MRGDGRRKGIGDQKKRNLNSVPILEVLIQAHANRGCEWPKNEEINQHLHEGRLCEVRRTSGPSSSLNQQYSSTLTTMPSHKPNLTYSTTAAAPPLFQIKMLSSYKEFAIPRSKTFSKRPNLSLFTPSSRHVHQPRYLWVAGGEKCIDQREADMHPGADPEKRDRPESARSVNRGAEG